MLQLKNFGDVYHLLEGYAGSTRSTEAYNLDRMCALMSALGDPQDQYKVIHIAGTSGKTSTACFTASLLKQASQKVGLTVSPHVSEVNERVQINLEPIDEKNFCQELSIFLDELIKTTIEPTYYELLVAFAYWEFARQQVDYAVVEVGVGGLLDGTNVISRADKVCVITDIGLDHMSTLGKSLAAIAAQKAGIIHHHNLVIMYRQDEQVMRVVREVVEQQQAELHEIFPDTNRLLPGKLPLFQQRNWYLAQQVYQQVAERDKLPELTSAQVAASAEITIPARMETVQVGDKTVILDGAHNAQKMQALAASISNRYPEQSVAIMLSLVESKDFTTRTDLAPILKLASSVIITTYKTWGGFKRSVNPEQIADLCTANGFKNLTIITDPSDAYQALLERPESILLVTGSFYLIGQIRSLVKPNETPAG